MWETLSLFLGIWLLFLLLAIYYLSQAPDGRVGRFRKSDSEHLSAESRAKVMRRDAHIHFPFTRNLTLGLLERREQA